MISIIIPTRNRYSYIRLLLEDIHRQDLEWPYEVLVVDQSDHKESLIDCIHIPTSTLGPCVSRNMGVKAAKGDVLVFLDDDARIETDFIKEMVSPILEGRFMAVAGSNCDINGNYKADPEDYLTRKEVNFIKLFTSNPNHKESRISMALPGCCMAMKRSCLEAVGGFDESLDPTGAGEDRDLAIKFYKAGYAIWYNAKAKLFHDRHAKGGSKDVGSRNLMLDVHTYHICKKHFSKELAEGLKLVILDVYRRKFYKAIRKQRMIGTKYRMYQQAKKMMN